MNPLHEEYEEKRSAWARFRDRFMGNEEEEEEEDTQEPPHTTSRNTTSQTATRNASKPDLRMHMSRSSRVALRLNLQIIDDAKIAADGLKMGEHQIINLEKAKPEMAERILDFLVGACYALDGKVIRIGDRVYMFVPANVDVDVADEGSPVYRHAPYADDAP